MTRAYLVLWSVLLASVAAAPVHAQETGHPEPAAAAQQTLTLHELVLNDGSRLYGTVERDDGVDVIFRTQAGAVLTVRRTEIVTLKPAHGTVVSSGEFYPADPNATRLFFAPTGRALRKGQTYFGVFEFLMPFVQHGITDRVSIGGGTPLLFGFDEGNRPFWLTPKVQVYDSPQTQVSLGTFHMFSAGGDNAGIAYVVGTRGTSATSVTVGAGLGYARGGERATLVMLGAEHQVRRNVKVITENYAASGGGIASVGVRFFGPRLSADVGVAIPIGMEDIVVFPVVSFVYVFDK